MKWVCWPIVFAASILTLAITVTPDLVNCQLVRPEGKLSRVGTNLGVATHLVVYQAGSMAYLQQLIALECKFMHYSLRRLVIML